MIFGDPSLYAIEAYHEPSGLKGMWGRICLHINGIPFGDITEPSCCLGPTFNHLGWLALNASSLWHESFGPHGDYDLYELLDSALYRDTGQTLLEAQRDWAEYGRHVFLTNWGEQFDRAPKCFVIGGPESVSILWRDVDDVQQRAAIPLEIFTTVSAAAHEWYIGEERLLKVG